MHTIPTEKQDFEVAHILKSTPSIWPKSQMTWRLGRGWKARKMGQNTPGEGKTK
jgi:hypothetical protein